MSSFSRNPYLGKAWEAALKKEDGNKETDPSVEKITKMITKFTKESPKEVEETLKGLPDKHPWFNDSAAFSVVFKRWIRSYVDMMMSEPNRTDYLVPANARELVEDALTGADPISVIPALVLDWRNLSMAKNLARFYCDVLKENKAVRVIVGSFHIPGMEKLIEQMSGGLVKTERKVDDGEEWVKEVRKELAEIKRKEAEGALKAPTVEVKDEPVRIVENPGAPEKNVIQFVKNGVRYTLHLGDVLNDPLISVGYAQRKGEIAISAPEKEQNGRLKYFLAEIENASKADKKIEAAVKGLNLPAASSIPGDPISGKAASGFFRIVPQKK